MNIPGINELTSKGRSYYIEIYSFSAGAYLNTNQVAQKTIKFPAFITDYSDSFKSNWKKEEVFGKMDPISTFKNTARTISVAFDIPNDALETAKETLKKIDFLIRGMYPVYDEGVYGTSIISSPPMFRVRFANLINNSTQLTDGDTLKTGLLCYIEGFDFKPKVDSGFFVDGEKLFPKLISANLTMQIIHEHALGNYKVNDGTGARKKFQNFPHHVSDDKDIEPNNNRAAAATPSATQTPNGATTSQPSTKTQSAAKGNAEKAICSGGALGGGKTNIGS